MGAASVSRGYWVAGLLMYVISFLCSWSIGPHLLDTTFVLFSLGIAHGLGLVKQGWHVLAAAVIGLVLWLGAITFIDDYWLFF